MNTVPRICIFLASPGDVNEERSISLKRWTSLNMTPSFAKVAQGASRSMPLEVELGYFALSELESARSPQGLPVERDLYFEPKTLRELKDLHQRGEVGEA
jgi:hypothetical protein